MSGPCAGDGVDWLYAGPWTAAAVGEAAGRLRIVEGPHVGMTLAEARAAVLRDGGTVHEAAANEAMARAFNASVAEGEALSAVVHGHEGPAIAVFELDEAPAGAVAAR